MPCLRGADRDSESKAGFGPDVRAGCSDRTGVCLGGMYRMALKQIDGHSIGLHDLVSGTDILQSLALASLLAGLAALAGFVCPVIPGWIISGILMFTLPLVVDERLKATDAIIDLI